MPLGGFCRLGAEGAMSLGKDIEAFNSKTKIDHLFLDAGTGLTAASVIAYLETTCFCGTIYVVAMGRLDFNEVLTQVKEMLNVKSSRLQVKQFEPNCGKRYGSKPKELQNYADQFYKKNGILLDPIYNVKLFHTFEKFTQTIPSSENCLIVHSGGSLSAIDELI